MKPKKRRTTYPTKTSGWIILVAAMIVVVYGAIAGGNLFEPIPGEAPHHDIEAEGWITVYFTDPEVSGSVDKRGGPDAHLVSAIDRARLSVDMAIYDLNLWSIRDALLAAHRRGVAVRVVCESDNMDRPEMQTLIEAGIPILCDRRQGLMHNKFVIIDRLEVWTGSMNFTLRGAYQNNNNLIRIRSTNLARNYLVEFEEMFVDDLFGPRSPANTPYSTLSIDGTLLEVYFSPDDGAAREIVRLIGDADESIYFLAFSFTSDDIGAAMLDRAEAGVTVAGVIEASQYRTNVGSEFDTLRAAGLDVRLDGNPYNMHHKVIVLDGKTVITGSYNFSASAEKRNDENTLVIHNEDVAGLFLEEFERVFSQAQR